jgi:hypothetical protein
MVLIFNDASVWSVPVALVVLAVCLVYIYERMDAREHAHSRTGLERLRIKEASALKNKEMDQAHELRKTALEQYIKTLEGGND